VTCLAPTREFDSYEQAFRECLASFRLGAEEGAQGDAVYRDRLYDFVLAIPEMPGRRSHVRFSSAREDALFDVVDLEETSGGELRPAWLEAFQNKATRAGWNVLSTSEVSLAQREALLLECDHDDARAACAAVFRPESTVVVTCTCRRSEFAERSAAFKACLGSIEVSK
jgi:hypothetical protein